MRIIAGELRRRMLKAPKGLLTRPTSDRVKESLFNMLESRIHLNEADVLDLFAGTGSLGLEALSRGASAVTFVESQAAVLKFCRANAADLGVEEACAFFQVDAVSFLNSFRGPTFDVIFADPPYDLPTLPRLPDLAIPLLSDLGVFILEHDQRHSFEEHVQLVTSRVYGRTTVSLFMNDLNS